MSEHYEACGQCEACDVDGRERPVHVEYGLCERCVRDRGWPDESDGASA
jgi:ribosomal protein S14